MSIPNSPRALFFGIADRAAYVADGADHPYKWNVLGLRNIVLSYLFPLPFPQCHFAIALSPDSLIQSHQFIFVDESEKELGRIEIKTGTILKEEVLSISDRGSTCFVSSSFGWSLVFIPITTLDIVINKPGSIQIRYETVAGPVLGELSFAVVDPTPLSAERIAAIKSDPGAAKAVRIIYGCKFCEAKCKTYAALERDVKSEMEGWIWYSELPDKFICKCKKTEMNLDIVRRNLHALLGTRQLNSPNMEFMPLYERSALASLRNRYALLLNASPREEDLQNFIEDNPVLLHLFPAIRLFHKAPILTGYKSDFVIVTPQKELILIEIEKTTTRLLNKDGGVAADLQHAFDQVRSWLDVVDEHRLAVLGSLKVERNEVSSVRGVVIAGRNQTYDETHLRRLKGQDWGRITFLTYDDLLSSLDSLIEGLCRL